MADCYPEDRIATVQKWRNTVQDQRAADAEYRLKGQDGNYRWMRVHAVPLRGEDGKIVKWFGINIDIHDSKHQAIDPNPLGDSV